MNFRKNELLPKTSPERLHVELWEDSVIIYKDWLARHKEHIVSNMPIDLSTLQGPASFSDSTIGRQGQYKVSPTDLRLRIFDGDYRVGVALDGPWQSKLIVIEEEFRPQTNEK